MVHPHQSPSSFQSTSVMLREQSQPICFPHRGLDWNSETSAGRQRTRHQRRSYRWAASIIDQERECTKVTALHCDHKEADTRMLLHAKHASRDAQRVVIQSPDTDVLLLCVTHSDEIKCDELWICTGVKDYLCYIPAHKIAAGLVPFMCKVLPAFYALTGCSKTFFS